MSAPTTQEFKVIGTRPVRHDGLDKVIGRAKYGADYSFPGMLHGKMLRSPHAHARIKSINVEKALAFARRQSGRDRTRILPRRPWRRFIAWAARRPSIRSISPPISWPRTRCCIMAMGSRRWRDQSAYRRGSARPDRGRVRSAAASSRRPGGDEARRADRQFRYPANKTEPATKQTNVAGALPVQTRRYRRRLQGGRLHRRARVPHRDGPSGLYRAAQRAGHLPEPTAAPPSIARPRAPFEVRLMSATLLGLPEGNVKVVPAEIGGGFGGKTERPSRTAGVCSWPSIPAVRSRW